jgi:hypothetical protein
MGVRLTKVEVTCLLPEQVYGGLEGHMLWYDLDDHVDMLCLVCLLEMDSPSFHHSPTLNLAHTNGSTKVVLHTKVSTKVALGHGLSIFSILIYVGIDIPRIHICFLLRHDTTL